MYLKKVNFVIYLALALLVGFGSSFLIKGMDVQSDMVSGNIAKANLYNNQKDDPAISIMEEKLRNDTTYLKQTVYTMALLKSRVHTLNELTEKTIAVCSDIPEMESIMLGLQSLNAKSVNTDASIDAVSTGLIKIIEGKPAPEYEIASNNTYLGYRKINNQLALGISFVKAAEKYISGNGKKASEVAGLVAEWSNYCVMDACLNKDNEKLTAWGTSLKEASELPSVVDAFSKSDNLSAIDAFGGVENFGTVIDAFGKVENFGSAIDAFGKVENFGSAIDAFSGVENFGSVIDAFGGVENFGSVIDAFGGVENFGSVIDAFGGVENFCKIFDAFGEVENFGSVIDAFGGAENFGSAIDAFSGVDNFGKVIDAFGGVENFGNVIDAFSGVENFGSAIDAFCGVENFSSAIDSSSSLIRLLSIPSSR